MREKSTLEFYWNNPPDGTGSLNKIIGRRNYVREVNEKSLLNPVEVSKVLNVSLVHVHRLIKRGQLKTIRNSTLVRMKDLLDFKNTRKLPGRPRKEIPYLIG